MYLNYKMYSLYLWLKFFICHVHNIYNEAGDKIGSLQQLSHAICIKRIKSQK